MKQQEQETVCFHMYVIKVKNLKTYIHKAHAMLSTIVLHIQLLFLPSSTAEKTAFLIMYVQHLAQLSRTSRLY